MPWWEKGLKSVVGQAEKVSFEAERLVRVRREEGISADLRDKIQGKVGELGQAALDLCRRGVLNDPALLALVQEISGLEDQLKQQDAKIEAIRAEQWQGGAEAAAPASQAAATSEIIKTDLPQQASQSSAAPEVGGTPTGAPASAAPETGGTSAALAGPPAVPAAAPLVECPACHTQVRSNAVFCPECGTRLK